MVSNLVTIATNYFVSTNWFLFHDFLVVYTRNNDGRASKKEMLHGANVDLAFQ